MATLKFILFVITLVYLVYPIDCSKKFLYGIALATVISAAQNRYHHPHPVYLPIPIRQKIVHHVDHLDHHHHVDYHHINHHFDSIDDHHQNHAHLWDNLDEHYIDYDKHSNKFGYSH